MHKVPAALSPRRLLQAAACACLACLLAGCANTETRMEDVINRWTNPRYPPQLSDAQAQAVSDELATWRARRELIRSAYAGESDPAVRRQHYQELHNIGLVISPLERQLAAAGRPLR